jgi:hypothetical protein
MSGIKSVNDCVAESVIPNKYRQHGTISTPKNINPIYELAKRNFTLKSHPTDAATLTEIENVGKKIKNHNIQHTLEMTLP